MTHWSHPYVGQPYIVDEMDCGGWAEKILLEVFGKRVDMPKERGVGLRGKSNQIKALKADFTVPTDTPEEGDAVLMIGRGDLDHIGLYCVIDGEAWVLHAMKSAGEVVRHRLRALEFLNLKVEGFYRWK